jgi:acyl dehydratase
MLWNHGGSVSGGDSDLQVMSNLSVDAATFSLADLQVGKEVSFRKFISEKDVNAFAELSGDFSPLHMDETFALSRGFKRRVVHGAYLAGMASQIVGMHLPGKNCLLQTIHMKFFAPTYVGDTVLVAGVVDQVSVAARAVVIAIKITDWTTATVQATGKANIGFTEAQSP